MDMKKLAALLLGLFLPVLAFAQGTAIRSFNGVGTNTVFYKSGSPTREALNINARWTTDANGNLSLDWGNRKLYDGTVEVMDYFNKTFSTTGWIFLSITNHNDVSAGAMVSGGYYGYDGLTGKLTNGPPATYSPPLLTNTIGITFDGATATIPTNITRYLVVPYNCTIIGFTMLSDASTISVVDVMRCTYAEFDAGSTHPVIGDKITASLPPTINPSLYKTNVTSIATWSASLTNGNVVAFRTITNTAATTLTLSLQVTHAP